MHACHWMSLFHISTATLFTKWQLLIFNRDPLPARIARILRVLYCVFFSFFSGLLGPGNSVSATALLSHSCRRRTGGRFLPDTIMARFTKLIRDSLVICRKHRSIDLSIRRSSGGGPLRTAVLRHLRATASGHHLWKPRLCLWIRGLVWSDQDSANSVLKICERTY